MGGSSWTPARAAGRGKGSWSGQQRGPEHPRRQLSQDRPPTRVSTSTEDTQATARPPGPARLLRLGTGGCELCAQSPSPHLLAPRHSPPFPPALHVPRDRQACGTCLVWKINPQEGDKRGPHHCPGEANTWLLPGDIWGEVWGCYPEG